MQISDEHLAEMTLIDHSRAQREAWAAMMKLARVKRSTKKGR